MKKAQFHRQVLEQLAISLEILISKDQKIK